MRAYQRFSCVAVGIIASISLCACSDDDDDDGGGGGGGAATVDVLVSDAPYTDLLSFTATINEVRLERDGGTTTGNLLSAPVTLEFLGLHESPAWIARAQVPAGTYTGVRLVFDPTSIEARTMAGTEVAVTALATQYTAPMDSDVQIGNGEYHRLIADLALSTSLQGSIDSPPLEFSPGGFTTHDTGVTPLPVASVSGIVTSASSTNGSLQLSATAGNEGTTQLGSIPVSIAPTTTLIQDDGTPFTTSQDFYDALVNGTTPLTLQGELVGNTFHASSIALQNNTVGGGNANLVKLNGVVIGTGAGDSFDIAVSNVSKGSSIVEPAFGGEVPSTLTASWDPSTNFVFANGDTATAANPPIGQTVAVDFPTFSNAPFLASQVQMKSPDVGFTGTVTSVDGLPGSFVMNLSPHSPAVAAGLVSSSTTDVVVDTTNGTFGIDTATPGTLTASDLAVGMSVQAQGALAGPAATPTLTASNTMVFPGQLANATVTSSSPGTFTTTGGQINNPFGGGIVDGPMTVTFAPNAVFRGSATSQSSFDTLFNTGLTAGQTMNVQLQGIPSSTPGTIVAHDVTSQVVP